MPAAPRISVIIPIFNMGAYLSECLTSVLQQSLQSIELICVNDGSNDESADILKHFEQQDSRVRVISKENQGVSAARNDAIHAATGEYLYFLDPDDRLPARDTLELLYTKATTHSAFICGGAIAYFKPDQPELKQKFAPELQGYLFPQEGRISYADYQFDFGFTRFIYQRKMIVEHKLFFPPYTFFEDPPFLVRAMLCAGWFYAITQTTYAYRVGHHRINWTPQKVTHLFSGLQEIWQLATEQRLSRLQQYVWYRLRSFYSDTLRLLSPEHKQFAQEVDNTARPTPKSRFRWVFSKNKFFLNKNMRQFTILGFKLTKIKKA